MSIESVTEERMQSRAAGAGSTPAAPDEILTTRGAAQLLGVAVSTVQQWVNSGQLKSWSTPGGHRRIPLAAVQQLLGAADAAQAQPQPATASAHAAAPALPPGSFPVGQHESARLQAVMDSGLFDSAPEPAYDRLVRLAGQVAAAPVALFTVLGHDRQWFKAHVGTALAETPRSWALCNYTVLGDTPLIVPDALADARFRENPLVTGPPGLRFYAGFPLHDRGGRSIGTLCVLDYVARQLSDEQRWALGELALLMSEEIQRAGAAVTPPPAP